MVDLLTKAAHISFRRNGTYVRFNASRFVRLSCTVTYVFTFLLQIKLHPSYLKFKNVLTIRGKCRFFCIRHVPPTVLSVQRIVNCSMKPQKVSIINNNHVHRAYRIRVNDLQESGPVWSKVSNTAVVAKASSKKSTAQLQSGVSFWINKVQSSTENFSRPDHLKFGNSYLGHFCLEEMSFNAEEELSSLAGYIQHNKLFANLLRLSQSRDVASWLLVNGQRCLC